MLKRCSTCKIVKDISKYCRNRTTKDGFQCQCKECMARYYKGNKDKRAKYYRQYQKEHKEEIAIVKRQYRERNKDEQAKYLWKYNQTDKGKLVNRANSHKRRMLAKTTKSDLTLEQWTNIIKQQCNKCNLCGKRFGIKRKPTMDHILPLSIGGRLTSDNIQALCKSCNSSKHAKLDKQFIQTWLHRETNRQV